jgi:hypothetical protein
VVDEKSNGGVGDAAREKDLEWPPGPYESTSEAAVTSVPSMRVVHCPDENCKALNPTKLLFCWKCGTSMVQGEEAAPPWSLRRALRLEKAPLRAGERARPNKPFLSKNPITLLRAGLVVLAVLLLVGALVIGAVKAWDWTQPRAVGWYASAREALFPRFHPVHVSSVNPTLTSHGKELKHPALDAFDRSLSTYWQSNTARHIWDKIRVNFKPPAKEINEITVFAGDPTATTIVPRAIQMTFYRWEPRPSQNPRCNAHRKGPHFPQRLRERGAFCVVGIAKQFPLLNTPTEQRFSTGTETNIGQIVITVRGAHRTAKKNAKTALTEVEFYDKH